MRFFPLEKLINLQDGYIRRFKIDELQLLLIKHRGEVYLLEATCPHRNYPLDEALIVDGIIRCPSHQYEFSLSDGKLLRATEDTCRGLRTFTVIYEGNEVGVMLDRA